MKKMVRKFALVVGMPLLLAGCGSMSEEEARYGGKTPPRPPAPAAAASPSAGLAAALTPFELEHGIGPIKERLPLGSLDQELASQGEEIFESKCSACHRLDQQRFVGPTLAGITDKRSPEFIMNMILNPEEMIQKHPVVHDLFVEYLIPMTFQNLTQEDARAVLEFFRAHDKQESTVSKSASEASQESF